MNNTDPVEPVKHELQPQALVEFAVQGYRWQTPELNDPGIGGLMSKQEKIVLMSVAAILLVISGIGPYDRITWCLEVAPVLLAAPRGTCSSALSGR